VAVIPYCGTPPSPGELLERFNLDPVLIGALLVLLMFHLARAQEPRTRTYAAIGWITAAAALISPLCALSVSLFAARIGQHMLLLLVAAPFIALALPPGSASRGPARLVILSAFFFGALWFWHMPYPYDLTFTSTSLYWLMHVTLFGSGVLLWRELLHHREEDAGLALLCGLSTSMQMGFLGALLALAGHAQFSAHFLTSWVWGLSPLQDQELGGTIMWVPGIALFLWAALRSLQRLWAAFEAPKPT
jgi:putative membrane protein